MLAHLLAEHEELRVGDVGRGATLPEIDGVAHEAEAEEDLEPRDHPWRRGVLQPGHLTGVVVGRRSEEHTSELQSLMHISYAVFCLKKKHTRSPAPPSTDKWRRGLSGAMQCTQKH